jgi:hypothetical protein
VPRDRYAFSTQSRNDLVQASGKRPRRTLLVRDARGVPCGGKRRLLLVHTTDTAKAQNVKRDHWYGIASTLGACSWLGYGRWSRAVPCGWKRPRRLLLILLLRLVHTTDTAKAQSVKRDHWYGTASTLGACSWMGYGRWSGCKPAWRVPTWSWFTRVTSVPEARIVMNGFRAW